MAAKVRYSTKRKPVGPLCPFVPEDVDISQIFDDLELTYQPKHFIKCRQNITSLAEETLNSDTTLNAVVILGFIIVLGCSFSDFLPS